ncbi:MnhB domain-containing protein [Sedimentitalea sp. JM2-8]|uniref:MnhB domain-containing protein n=1 Tax=Sedimentitalea xiamensis TaxID=3050037 RepID=A0ABT7FCP8_9RHOB|nr:hydrogen gas-evolving membrane-bound hydrogenase subunit E [Sedimentitalea xiamensis]MDK3072895.1 MnhB domain-containing protein [Sedimentitalea xiamensis]
MTGRTVHLGLSALALAGLAFAFSRLVGAHVEPTALGQLAAGYIRLSPEELSVPNVVTGILLAYRSFDTLGEVAVLYMVAASLGPLLQPMDNPVASETPRLSENAGEIIHSGHFALLPLIGVFGAYVILFGHLSAGGGFQGGAIIATGIEFYMIARVASAINVKAFSALESGVGVLFVAVGVFGLVFAGGFLDPRFLPAGELGHFVSGGAIPLVSLLLGIKVAAELSVVLERFRG